MSSISDGTGTGSVAKVDVNNRVHTKAVVVTEQAAEMKIGNAYNINTGLLTLTSAAESGVLYFKNTNSVDIHLVGIVCIFGPSTGGDTSDTTHIRVYRNPTTGTLIGDASAVGVNSNRDFGSSSTLDADVYKGGTGKTITDGTVHIESLISPGNRVFFNIDEYIRKDNSIAISFEPNDSNTSMKVMAALILHQETV
jgi:hypothetical protein